MTAKYAFVGLLLLGLAAGCTRQTPDAFPETEAVALFDVGEPLTQEAGSDTSTCFIYPEDLAIEPHPGEALPSGLVEAVMALDPDRSAYILVAGNDCMACTTFVSRYLHHHLSEDALVVVEDVLHEQYFRTIRGVDSTQIVIQPRAFFRPYLGYDLPAVITREAEAAPGQPAYRVLLRPPW